MDKISEIIEKIKAGNIGIQRLGIDYDNRVITEIWNSIYGALIGEKKLEKQGYWQELILWLMADPKCKINPKKGIGLVGNSGIGKTTAMKVINIISEHGGIYYKHNEKLVPLKFHIFNSRDIINFFERDGYDGISKLYNYENIMIDDLGAETSQANYFGTAINVLQDIIERRYDKGLLLHFTSNYSVHEIQEKYGYRVYSRLMEQVNIIELQGKDFRIKK